MSDELQPSLHLVTNYWIFEVNAEMALGTVDGCLKEILCCEGREEEGEENDDESMQKRHHSLHRSLQAIISRRPSY